MKKPETSREELFDTVRNMNFSKFYPEHDLCKFFATLSEKKRVNGKFADDVGLLAAAMAATWKMWAAVHGRANSTKIIELLCNYASVELPTRKGAPESDDSHAPTGEEPPKKREETGKMRLENLEELTKLSMERNHYISFYRDISGGSASNDTFELRAQRGPDWSILGIEKSDAAFDRVECDIKDTVLQAINEVEDSIAALGIDVVRFHGSEDWDRIVKGEATPDECNSVEEVQRPVSQEDARVPPQQG